MPLPDQYFCHQCQVSFDMNPAGPIECVHCHGEFVEFVNRPAVVAATLPGGPTQMNIRNILVDLFRNNISDRLTRSPGNAQQTSQQQAQSNQSAPSDGHQSQPAAEEEPRVAAGGDPGATRADGDQPAPTLEDFIGNMFRQAEQRGAGEGAAQPQQTNPPPILFEIPGLGGVRIQHMQRGGPFGFVDGMVIGLDDEQMDADAAVSEIFAAFQQTDRGRTGPGRGFSEADITQYLPMSKITQEQIDNGAQCTTCFDTFKLDESVGALDCKHVFHRPCIEPWLKTKNSCPVCRQKVDMKEWKTRHQKKTQEAVLEDLD